ncbi:MAG: M15 family metallopeptidase [Chlamydiales bacterium]|nr:M15 family metallopeptidase [Chlamydiales bacterium]
MEKFVDLEKVNPNIVLDIRYATTNNFTGRKWYNLPKCFLRVSIAKKLDKVQKKLETRGLGLKVFDGYRPFFVTQGFWDLIHDSRYVADPTVGSKHNRGAAVDLTIINLKTRQEWLMPSNFDELTSRAHLDYFDGPRAAIENRSFLINVMLEEKFLTFPTEWWHFNDCNWEKYPIENVSFEEILSSDKWLDTSY